MIEKQGTWQLRATEAGRRIECCSGNEGRIGLWEMGGKMIARGGRYGGGVSEIIWISENTVHLHTDDASKNEGSTFLCFDTRALGAFSTYT